MGMREGRWLLYGANGYSGELIAEEAKRRGEQPILAGRRADAVRPLAERLGFEHRVFALADQAALDRALSEVAAVCLAAGPFSHTSRAVVDACLRAGCHYLDITGEIGVFEACLRRDAEARER
jgi:saccharopine dehydrogenase (NAD+, L-lysine-forming)